MKVSWAPMAFQIKSEYIKKYFFRRSISKRILFQQDFNLSCTGISVPSKNRLYEFIKESGREIFVSERTSREEKIAESFCVCGSHFLRNECWRSCYPDTMRPSKTVQHRVRERKKERERERGGTPPGATRRDAEVLHRYIRESRSRRSRDSLRCCLMRFGIRRNLEIPRTNTVWLPQVRGSIFNPQLRLGNLLDFRLMIVSWRSYYRTNL